jgi:predicted transcriptional regulator
MATKATFTLDEETMRTIRRMAERSRKPQSLIVREAVAHYAGREETLSEEERQRKLAILREFAARPPQAGDKTSEDVDRELEELRLARREGWARPSD